MIRILAFSWLVFAVTESAAHAHGFTIEASSQDGSLRVVVGYDTGEPAENATLTVTANSGEIVALGFSDPRGVWTHAIPPPGEYRVRADDGLGHGGQITIVVNAQHEVPAGPTPLPRWVRIVVGLIVIAGLTAGAKGLRRARARVGDAPPPTGPPASASPDDARAG